MKEKGTTMLTMVQQMTSPMILPMDVTNDTTNSITNVIPSTNGAKATNYFTDDTYCNSDLLPVL